MTTVTEPPRATRTTGRALRDAFAQFPSGVVAVAAEVDGAPVGMAVSAFAPVSLEPALVGIFVRNLSETWPELRRASSVGITVLGSAHAALARTLAGPAAQRFADVRLSRGDGDALFVDDAPMRMEAVVASEHPAGDHTLVLFEVRSADVQADRPALLFHGSALAGFTHAVGERP